MKVPAEALGKTATCVRCGERLRITVETADPSDWGSDSDLGSPPPSSDQGDVTTSGQDPVHVLRQHGLVDAEAIREASLVQRDIPRKTWDLLIELGHVGVEDFHAIMAKQKGLASIDLPNYNIPREVANLVSPEVANRGVLVPVDRLGRLLTLAMACPLDVEIIGEVEESTGLKVKPMLSRLDDLREVLCRQYGEQTIRDLRRGAPDDGLGEVAPQLKTNPVAQRVFTLESLAPFSQTLDRLAKVTKSSANGSLLQSATETVATDPVATAMLLRVANSEAYGFTGTVDGLGLACTLLGPDGIRTVVESVEAEDYLARDDGIDYAAFWKRAQFCSEAAQTIAGEMHSQVAINAYTAALLHEIGRLAMAAVLPNGYAEIMKGLNPAERTATETKMYQVTAADAGFLLASRWNLPESICEPIRCQRDPMQARSSRDVAAIVALAVHMADAHETGDSPSLDKAEGLLAELGLGPQVLGDVFRETVESASV